MRDKSFESGQRARLSVGGGMSSGLRAGMQPHPLYFDSGSGSKIRDVDGNEYIDYVLGWGPLIVGHSHPSIVREVTHQIARGQTFGAGHPLEYLVAERVLGNVPGAERLLWSNTGTEAVQVALRLARAHTGRNLIIKFAGGYHGWQDSALISYRGFVDQDGPVLNSRGQNPNVLPDTIVLPYNDIAAARAMIRARGSEIAAVIVEPVLANSGLIGAAEGFLEMLRAEADQAGCVLIFDEVITGFRIALGGAAERYGVIPDLSVFGKAIAGGFSLSAVAGRAEIIDLVTTGVVHSGTYNGNPVVLAAANATLGILEQPGLYQALDEAGQTLVSGLTDVFHSRGVEASVHGIGPMVQIALGTSRLETTEDYQRVEWSGWNALSVHLLDRGVFVLPGGRLFLSSAHSAADLSATVAAFDGAVSAFLDE